MKYLDLVLIMCPEWGLGQPPVGISYLKGFLEKYGISVKCFDLSMEFYKIFQREEYWCLNSPNIFCEMNEFNKYIFSDINPFLDDWAKKILDNNPKVVGLSLFKSTMNASLLLAKHLKKYQSNLNIVGGGAEVSRVKKVLKGPSINYSLINKSVFDDFDLLIEGEGEEALLEIFSLLKQDKSFYSIDGGIYLNNGNIAINKERNLIKNLDVLPPPSYSDYNLNNYTKETLPLVTSRGCVNRCTFCADSPLWKKYRYRSAERVVDEIRVLISEHKINRFEIVDSIFNGRIEGINEICDLIINAKLDIEWLAKVSLRKEMDYELLSKMKKAGCNCLAYGIESGSQQVLDDMRKNTNLKDITRIIRDTYEVGIKANCFFIIGYPIETEEYFQMTLDFIVKNAIFINRCDQITGCHIEEDSFLGNNLDKYGIFFKEDGWYNINSTPNIREKRLIRFQQVISDLHSKDGKAAGYKFQL